MPDDKLTITERNPLKDRTVVSPKTGRKLSETHEVKIRNITYIVTSEYQENGSTVTDILERMITRKAEAAIRNREI